MRVFLGKKFKLIGFYLACVIILLGGAQTVVYGLSKDTFIYKGKDSSRLKINQQSQNKFEKIIVKSDYEPEVLIVKFKKGFKEQAELNKQFNTKVIKKDPTLGYSKLKVVKGDKLEKVLKEFKNNPNVEYAHPDYILEAQATNDYYYSEQWALKTLNAVNAWEITKGNYYTVMSGQGKETFNNAQNLYVLSGQGLGPASENMFLGEGDRITVAVVDTGVDLYHPDLQQNLLPGFNVINPAAAPMDDEGHGTHVAGIVAGVSNNSIGISGIAPKVRILPVKVLDSNGRGSFSDIADGIKWAANNGAQIINLSLGAYLDSSGLEVNILQDAINYAASKGILVVAAAGNDGMPMELNMSSSVLRVYPAVLDNVIAVGATNESNHLASFSNFGPQLDIVAPGVNILSTVVGSYGFSNGTSMASPYVAGIAALIKANKPSISLTELREKALNSAVDIGVGGKDSAYGFGIINSSKALGGDVGSIFQRYQGDNLEDNNSLWTTTNITLGNTSNATIFPDSDVDYYKTDLRVGDRIQGMLIPPEGLDLVIDILYKPTLGDTFEYIDTVDLGYMGEPESFSIDILSNGSFIFRITEIESRSSSTPYQFSVEKVN